MRKDLYQPLWQSIVVGILLVIGGVIAFIHPFTVMLTLAVLLGVLITVRGIVLIVEFFQLRKMRISNWIIWLNVVAGVLLILMGIYLLANPGLSIFLVAQLVAIGFIADAIHNIAISYWIRPLSMGLWLSIMILNILLLISGIVLIFNWIATSGIVAVILSLNLIVSGIGNILVGFFNKRR